MKIKEYIMVKDNKNHPKLEELRSVDWEGELKYTDENYRMLKEIYKMDKLMEEYAYVIALDHEAKPKGVYQIGHGNPNKSEMHMQNIFTFLLLIGANAFLVAHNHVSDMIEPSIEDKFITTRISNIANIFDIQFFSHLIVCPRGYTVIDSNDSEKVEFYNEDSSSSIELLGNGRAARYICDIREEGTVEELKNKICD